MARLPSRALAAPPRPRPAPTEAAANQAGPIHDTRQPSLFLAPPRGQPDPGFWLAWLDANHPPRRGNP